MTDIKDAVDEIRETAERVGLVTLAREAGVPYTTLHTFARRGWQLKGLDMLVKLVDAKDRLKPANDASQTEAAA